MTNGQAQAPGLTFDEWSKLGDRGRTLNTASLILAIGGSVALVGGDVWAIVSFVNRKALFPRHRSPRKNTVWRAAGFIPVFRGKLIVEVARLGLRTAAAVRQGQARCAHRYATLDSPSRRCAGPSRAACWAVRSLPNDTSIHHIVDLASRSASYWLCSLPTEDSDGPAAGIRLVSSRHQRRSPRRGVLWTCLAIAKKPPR